MRLFRLVWDGLTRVMATIGHFISRNVVAPVLYYVVGALFTLPARVSDPLGLRPQPGRSHWHPREAAVSDSLERARSMY